MGRNGAVSTSHPLAAQIGIQVLAEGGNAVDAAVAVAAALTVLEPTSNGLGSDAFAIIWDGDKLHGLNASGRSPQELTLEELRKQAEVHNGKPRVPITGWLPVTTPGAVSAWTALVDRFGSMPLSRLVEPAAKYAETGHPVPPVIAHYWTFSEKRYANREEFRSVFLPQGRAVRAGEIFSCPEQAQTLRLIGESNGEAFYQGELADAIVKYASETGGYLTKADLAEHQPEWVKPISTNYRGYDVWEIPPNGQGITALIALNIIEEFEMDKYPQLSSRRLHLIIEALKLAFADAHRYVADPRLANVPTEGLLSKAYARDRRNLIDPKRAMPSVRPGDPLGDTVYLCTADKEGRMVSFIQSNYMGFGSGIVVPGTGITLQNRGCGFSLEEGHPNLYSPGKRPYHTIIPSFITRDGVPLAAYGVMGGDMQPQGHMQVVSGIADYQLNPQAAIDAPRVRVLDDGGVAIETTISPEVVRELAELGHDVRIDAEMAGFGGGQMIWRDPETEVYIAGSEPRKDGLALAL
ncbi:MAG: gamma-glutamyltransferase [Firmicutes bacterium]|nr:gamma-glutamyltransferase [Bacillota bacterium]